MTDTTYPARQKVDRNVLRSGKEEILAFGSYRPPPEELDSSTHSVSRPS